MDEYISSKLFPSQINPVLLSSMASEAPPSLPPMDGIPYWAASTNAMPNPSTDFLCIIEEN